MAVKRLRLGDLGRGMKAIKEHISRRANREDQCSGAFGEGRYVSVQLLDQTALTVCMAYVDLNPVRAKAAKLQARATTPAQRERAERMLRRAGLSSTAQGPGTVCGCRRWRPAAIVV